MSRSLAYLVAAAALTACAGPIPDSNPRGVGFGDYAAQQRDAELSGTTAPVPEERAIAQDTIAVLNATGDDLGTPPLTSMAPPTQTTQVIAAAPLTGNAGISDEQDFSAVLDRESIESDAERLARQRAAYVEIQPGDLPDRASASGPNVVAYALSTTNAVGQSLYRRGGIRSEARFQRACAGYLSQDRAQAAFLEAGGPQRDRKGLDPDGDGFACYWDPAPYRAARAGN